jgi:hypothetical protein
VTGNRLDRGGQQWQIQDLWRGWLIFFHVHLSPSFSSSSSFLPSLSSHSWLKFARGTPMDNMRVFWVGGLQASRWIRPYGAKNVTSEAKKPRTLPSYGGSLSGFLLVLLSPNPTK